MTVLYNLYNNYGLNWTKIAELHKHPATHVQLCRRRSIANLINAFSVDYGRRDNN